jgi:DNA-binding response OmpR family regulator
MYRLLLMDDDEIHAERLAVAIRERGLSVIIADSSEEAERRLRQRLPSFELLVIVALGTPEQSLAILGRVLKACRPYSMCQGPLILFVSRRKWSSHLRLRIERLGARYVRER